MNKLEQLRMDAQQVWADGGPVYIVQLTELPKFGLESGEDPDADQEPSRLLFERKAHIESGIAAITSVGWALTSLSLSVGSVEVLRSSVKYTNAHAAFTRPSESR